MASRSWRECSQSPSSGDVTTPTIWTIGYEQATLDAVIGALAEARVEVLADIRYLPLSRRPGFSKTMLGASLKEAGIDYLHLRGLGTPKAGRDAARAGRTAEMAAIFEAHLTEPKAQLELAQAREVAAERRAALLCFEAQACECHRRIVAEKLQADLNCEVVDL